MARSIAITLIIVLWAAQGCMTRARRPDGPYRAAEEFTDALSDKAVECTREHTPPGTGRVVVIAEFTATGQVPVVHDASRIPGSKAVIECVRRRVAEELRSPAAVPAPFVRIRVPLPLVTSEVTYAFLRELPNESAKPAPR